MIKELTGPIDNYFSQDNIDRLVLILSNLDSYIKLQHAIQKITELPAEEGLLLTIMDTEVTIPKKEVLSNLVLELDSIAYQLSINAALLNTNIVEKTLTILDSKGEEPSIKTVLVQKEETLRTDTGETTDVTLGSMVVDTDPGVQPIEPVSDTSDAEKLLKLIKDNPTIREALRLKVEMVNCEKDIPTEKPKRSPLIKGTNPPKSRPAIPRLTDKDWKTEFGENDSEPILRKD